MQEQLNMVVLLFSIILIYVGILNWSLKRNFIVNSVCRVLLISFAFQCHYKGPFSDSSGAYIYAYTHTYTHVLCVYHSTSKLALEEQLLITVDFGRIETAICFKSIC